MGDFTAAQYTTTPGFPLSADEMKRMKATLDAQREQRIKDERAVQKRTRELVEALRRGRQRAIEERLIPPD